MLKYLEMKECDVWDLLQNNLEGGFWGRAGEVIENKICCEPRGWSVGVYCGYLSAYVVFPQVY